MNPLSKFGWLAVQVFASFWAVISFVLVYVSYFSQTPMPDSLLLLPFAFIAAAAFFNYEREKLSDRLAHTHPSDIEFVRLRFGFYQNVGITTALAEIVLMIQKSVRCAKIISYQRAADSSIWELAIVMLLLVANVMWLNRIYKLIKNLRLEDAPQAPSSL